MDVMQWMRALVVSLLVVIGFGLAAHTVYWLFRYLLLGKREQRWDGWRERVCAFVRYALGQGRVIAEPAGILHFFIFWGFIVLQIETIEYLIRGVVDGFHWGQLIGAGAYDGLMFSQDVLGLLVLVAVSVALFRRYVVRPPHVVRTLDAALILVLIAALMVTKFLANGAEIGQGHQGHDAAWTPIASWVAALLGGGAGDGDSWRWAALYHVNYFLHIGIVVFFANWIPRGKHLHLLGALPNVYFSSFGKKVGALPPVDIESATEAMMDEATGESFYLGARHIHDLSWKQLLDTYACTECGRCEHYCPAYNTGKALNPMMVIHNLKDALKARGRAILREGVAADTFAPLADSVVSREELWACTTCGACVATCPVFIEHVNTIVDMRRHLAFHGEVPQELANTYRNLDQSANPWGLSGSRRGDWARDLGVPTVKSLGRAPEVLFFVGCAGSYDERQKKVAASFVRILQALEVDFAVLGAEEKCCGDTARRTGNEYLYWTLARQNIEVFERYQIRKVVTTCPHGYNVLRNEYPALGCELEVWHAADFLATYVRSGRLGFRASALGRVAYHDSCYLTRWNAMGAEPREILAAIPGVEPREFAACGNKAMCCGAGGGHMWMEEDAGQRVNVARADQALETGVDAVAVACPFCMTMLEDGLKHRQAEASLRLLDLVEIVAEHMEVRGAESSHGSVTESAVARD